MKVVYNFSSGEILSKNIRKSLKSAERFFSPKDIIIIYTPPFEEKDRLFFSKYRVMEKDRINMGGDYDIYMNRSYFDEVDDETIFFLDSDTELVKDPRELLKGDYDIACDIRTVPGYETHIGTQFFIVKNGHNKEIGSVWRNEYRNIKDKKIACKDEVSLYSTVKKLNLRIKEFPPGTIIGDQIPDYDTLIPTDNTYVIHYGHSGSK